MEEKTKKFVEKMLRDLMSDPEKLVGYLDLHVVRSMREGFVKGRKPMERWSLLNRLLAISQGATDARTKTAWKRVGRRVNAGATPIHILRPVWIHGRCKACGGSDKKCRWCHGTGFVHAMLGMALIDEYDVKDTTGRELKPRKVTGFAEGLPLKWLVEKLGLRIEVRSMASFYYGIYRPEVKEIEVCVKDEQVFLHELAHAIDDKLGTLERPGQKDFRERREMVAELAACALARLYGHGANLRFTRDYVEGWKIPELNLEAAFVELFGRVQAIIEFVHEQSTSLEERVRWMDAMNVDVEDGYRLVEKRKVLVGPNGRWSVRRFKKTIKLVKLEKMRKTLPDRVKAIYSKCGAEFERSKFLPYRTLCSVCK